MGRIPCGSRGYEVIREIPVYTYDTPLGRNDHDHPEKETLGLPVPGHPVVGLRLDLHRVYVRRDPRRERNHEEISSTHAWTRVHQVLLGCAPRQRGPKPTCSVRMGFPSSTTRGLTHSRLKRADRSGRYLVRYPHKSSESCSLKLKH